jgi:hypothetical protein
MIGILSPPYNVHALVRAENRISCIDIRVGPVTDLCVREQERRPSKP